MPVTFDFCCLIQLLQCQKLHEPIKTRIKTGLEIIGQLTQIDAKTSHPLTTNEAGERTSPALDVGN